jgi:hypothetical protein
LDTATTTTATTMAIAMAMAMAYYAMPRAGVHAHACLAAGLDGTCCGLVRVRVRSSMDPAGAEEHMGGESMGKGHR